MHNTKKKCFYEVLGVSKTATKDDIKKVYKKLAIKWHPDKNPGKEEEAAEVFKVVSEAYSVLSDDKKRQHYDRYGHAEPNGYDHGYDQGFNRGGNADFGFGKSSFQGRGGSSFDFTFERAEEIFRKAFGEDFRKAFEEDFPSFGSGFGRNKQKASNNQQQQQQRRGFFDDDDDDDFFGPSKGMKNMMKDFGFGDMGFGGFGGFGGKGRRDPFEEAFSNFGKMSNFMSAGFDDEGFGGASKSVSTSTIIKNGKKVTVTKTTVRNADGTSNTQVHETVHNDGKKIQDQRYTDNGQNYKISNDYGNGYGQKALGHHGYSSKSKY